MIYRKILFRAKNSHTGKWEYSECISTELEDGKLFFHWGNELEWTEVDKNTLGQYVELKDRKKNKIFDGDIISVSYRYDGVGAELCRVVYCDWLCAFRLIGDNNYMFIDLDIAEIEIIGNIYDNPELLENR